MYLTKDEIKDYIGNGKLVIRPFLEKESQIGEASIDFRLGYDFYVSIQGREAMIDTSYSKLPSNLTNFFQSTRRRLGDKFILHPNQTVLGTTLEYIKLPSDIYLNLTTRSSYARLGLVLNTSIQPGYCGCISLELINASKNTIQLTVGAPIFQGHFVKVGTEQNYFSKPRKYICQVRPILSSVNKDQDLFILNKILEDSNL
jgi:dCTP deaminase